MTEKYTKCKECGDALFPWEKLKGQDGICGYCHQKKNHEEALKKCQKN